MSSTSGTGSSLPQCNTIQGNKQYYDPHPVDGFMNTVGGGLSFYLNASSAACFLLLMVIAGVSTGWKNAITIVLAILALCSGGSALSGYVQMRKVQARLTDKCVPR